MPFSACLSRLIFRIGLALLAAVPAARAQSLFSGPCDRRDYPVLVYDAQFRRTHIVRRSVASSPTLGLTIAGEAFEFTKFLCDATPVEMYIVNRKLKESFNVTITGTVTVPSAVISIRGVTPLSQPPPATTTIPAPAPLAVSKGGTGVTVGSVSTIVNELLSAETFNLPEQALRLEAQQLRGQALEEIVTIQEYQDKLNHMVSILMPPGVPASGDAEGTATLTGLTSAFASVIAQVAAELPDQAPPHIVPDIEVRFDKINVRLGILIQDVQRLNTTIQAFPVSDQFIALQTVAENFENSLQVFRMDLQNVQLAVRVLQDLDTTSHDYLLERNAAAIRQELQTAFPSVPNMDANSISGIVTQKYNDGGRFVSSLFGPAGSLAALSARLASFPDDPLLRPGTMRARVDAVRSVFPTLRNAIDQLNATEAAAFDAINGRYRDIRIPSAQAAFLNIPPYAGNNTSVFYSVTGVESYQPYQMTNNETPQPAPAALQTPAAAPPAPAATTPPAPAATPAAATSTTPPPTAAATPAPAPAPPPEYNGNFQIHHFDLGTIFGGFGVSRIPTASYSVATVPCNATMPCTVSPTYFQVARSSSSWGAAAVAGIVLYFHAQDMYPGWKAPGPYGIFRSPGLLIGAAVYPLNQYYTGLSFEPVHGFTFAGGFTLGSESKLTPANFISQNLGAATMTVSGTTTSNPTPTLSTSTGYHGGVFFTVGFDINIFKSFFGALSQVGTPAPTGSTTP